MEMNLYDILVLIGQEEFNEEPDDFQKRLSIDIDDWKYETVELLEYDLEGGWSVESIILFQKSTQKFYAVELVFIGGEGYSESKETLQLDEVEPYEVTVTKYRLKDETNQENVSLDSPETT